MSVPSRNSSPSAIAGAERTFFVTSSIFGKRALLQSDRSARLFVDILYHYRADHRFLLHEFVVMPDHFHVLITVGRDTSIERAVQFIKGGFAYRAGKELGLRAPVWQKGFSEVRVLSEIAFDEMRDYIRNNPVRRHLVDEPFLFPYSSAATEFLLDPMPQRLKPPSNRNTLGMAQAMP